MTTHHIAKEKIELHLKLGRKLALFIKTDTFFDAATFDWISLEKHGNAYKSTLVRTINQGDELFNDVLSFDTLNQDETDFDETTNHFFIGNLNDCFTWIETNYGVKEVQFTPLDNLKQIYTDLVEKGVFEK